MRLTKAKIKELFTLLGEALMKAGVEGEIGVVGGAAMVLAFDARIATKDVDAIFKPSEIIRSAAKEIAKKEQLPEDWLNDAVKGFMPKNPKRKIVIFETPGLRVWVPEPEYLLAMKAISARVDTNDADDLRRLIKELKLKTSESVFKLVEQYFPSKQIPAKLKYFVEELFEQTKST